MYFLVLSLLSLLVSFPLFRTLRSSALVRGTWWGMTFTFTGAAAFFFAFVVVGTKLTKPEPSFALVIRVTDQAGKKITSGKITIDFGQDRRGPFSINDTGEVHVLSVPVSFIGRDVSVDLEVPGHDMVGPSSVTLDATGVLALKVARLPMPRWKIAGRVITPTGQAVSEARVAIPELSVATETNQDGYFKLELSADPNTAVLLHAEKGAVGTFNGTVTPGNTELDIILGSSR